MGEIPQKPVDGQWYQFDQPAIVFPGYGARLEIVPTAVLYPSFGTDPSNMVAFVLRVATEDVSTQFEWGGPIEEFSVLYETLKAFPVEKSRIEFPTQVSSFVGAHVEIEPIGIHGWQAQCIFRHGHDTDDPKLTRSTVQVRFRLNVTDMQARQQTADFLRFVASLANEVQTGQE